MVFTLAAAAVGQTRLTLGQVNAPVAALGADNTTELDRGVINLVDNQVDQTTGTIKLKATFPNQALETVAGQFRQRPHHGRYPAQRGHGAMRSRSAMARAAISSGSPSPTIPRRFARVVVGQVFGGRALINRGLAKGEQVVTEGYYRLENGSRIEIERAAPKPALAERADPRSAEPG